MSGPPDREGSRPGQSRKGQRKRRRSKTIANKRLTRDEVQLGKELAELMDYRRPLHRSECVDRQRPCPFVSCKYHLFLDVNPITGSIKLNFPDLEVWEIKETCALDVAEKGGITLEEVGEILNLTRERVRQLEVKGILKIREVHHLDDEDAPQEDDSEQEVAEDE